MKLENLTWNEINTAKSVIILPIAPIEEHGQHLPICVDYYMSKHWAKDSAKELNAKGGEHQYYTLSAIPIGHANMKTFPGNIHIKQSTMYRLTKEILLNICAWGIKNIVIISAHADPKHLIAIEQACDYVNRKKGVCAFSPMGAIFSGVHAGIDLNHYDEVKHMLKEYPNDYHAGWVETSLMLFYCKNLVKKNFKSAKDVKIKDKDMAFANKVNKKLANTGHLGYPRLATYELGEKLHCNMVENIVKATEKFINRIDYKKYQHHFLYKIPFLRVGIIRR